MSIEVLAVLSFGALITALCATGCAIMAVINWFKEGEPPNVPQL